jgi:hypothetical protein
MSTQINGQSTLDIKEPCKYFDPNEIDCDETTKICYGTVHYHLGTANDLFERKQYKLSLPDTLAGAKLVQATVDTIKVFGKELGSRKITDRLYTYLDNKSQFGYIRIPLSKTDKTIMKHHSNIDDDTYLFIPYQGSSEADAASADTFVSKLATFLETSALNSLKAATAEGHFLTKVEVSKVKKGRAIILASAFKIQLTVLSALDSYDTSPTVFPAGKENTDKPSESEVHYTNCRLNIGGNEEYVSLDDFSSTVTSRSTSASGSTPSWLYSTSFSRSARTRKSC